MVRSWQKMSLVSARQSYDKQGYDQAPYQGNQEKDEFQGPHGPHGLAHERGISCPHGSFLLHISLESPERFLQYRHPFPSRSVTTATVTNLI